MEKNGKQIIDAIVRRLDDKDIRCYDSAIVAELSRLNGYELNQLITSGEVDKWLTERNKQKQEKQKPF